MSRFDLAVSLVAKGRLAVGCAASRQLSLTREGSRLPQTRRSGIPTAIPQRRRAFRTRLIVKSVRWHLRIEGVASCTAGVHRAFGVDDRQTGLQIYIVHLAADKTPPWPNFRRTTVQKPLFSLIRMSLPPLKKIAKQSLSLRITARYVRLTG